MNWPVLWWWHCTHSGSLHGRFDADQMRFRSRYRLHGGVNSSSAGDGKQLGGEDVLIEFVPCDTASCGRKHHPRTSSPQGSRRMAPPQSSPSPLWPLSLVIYRYGQFTRLHPDVGSGFSVPEITLYLLWTQLEQATHKLNFVLTPKRHQAQGCLSDFWSISGPVQQYQYSAIWLLYP